MLLLLHIRPGCRLGDTSFLWWAVVFCSLLTLYRDGDRLAYELKMLCGLLVGPCEWTARSEAAAAVCSLFSAIWWMLYRWLYLPRLLSVPPLLRPPEPGTPPSAILSVLVPITVPDPCVCASRASTGLSHSEDCKPRSREVE